MFNQATNVLTQMRRRFQHAARRMVVWCLLVAVPVFGVSGTLVELLGTNHVHLPAASANPRGADPMRGWVDGRRAPSASMLTLSHAHSHSHSHTTLSRHHHDRGDASVIALDGGLQGEASDDGGASTGSLSHVLALPDLTTFALPPVANFAWLATAPAAVMRWTADGPLRPPKA